MRAAPDWERAMGIEVYASESPPCGGRAKVLDGDFVVEESASLSGLTQEPAPGYYPLYRVEKRSIDTLHLEAELARALGSRVSYGGLKDKRAVAVQYFTATGRSPRKREAVEGRNFRATLVGYVPKPIARGSVIGNRFGITLRGCGPATASAVEEVFGLAEKRLLPNFFGHQRFGVRGARTSDVGRAMVREEFEEATRLVLCGWRGEEGGEGAAAREAFADGRYGEGVALLGPGQDTERAVAASLAKDPLDHVGALRAIPIRLRKLFVHAYQSLLFNRAISLALGRGLDISAYQSGDNWADGVGGRIHGVKEPAPDGAVPVAQIPGYAYRDYGSRFDALVSEVLSSDGSRAGDFYVKRMQEVSAEGGFRVPHLVASDLSSEFDGRDAVLRFALARGQYATVILREVMKPGDPRELGVS